MWTNRQVAVNHNMPLADECGHLFSWYNNEMNVVANMPRMVESDVEEFEDEENVQQINMKISS